MKGLVSFFHLVRAELLDELLDYLVLNQERRSQEQERRCAATGAHLLEERVLDLPVLKTEFLRRVDVRPAIRRRQNNLGTVLRLDALLLQQRLADGNQIRLIAPLRSKA